MSGGGVSGNSLAATARPIGSSADDLVALMHQLIQRQAALVQLQTESVHLQRRLIECVLAARTADPDVTANGVLAEGPPRNKSGHKSPAQAYLVAAQVAVATGRTLPRSLTCREREVAMLVAKGMTNRQIAAQLVIAERTADTHVQNLLGKLGCGSRSQVAAVLPSGADEQL
jgi:DNA-binding NarL/FixJ family response regulator